MFTDFIAECRTMKVKLPLLSEDTLVARVTPAVRDAVLPETVTAAA
jgi:hypothetical protein